MSPLPRSSFWTIQCYTCLGTLAPEYFGKLQSRLVRQGWCTTSGILLGMPLSRSNSFETLAYPGTMNSPVLPLGSLGHRYIESAPTFYSDLVVTSSQPLWPCFQVILLWKDSRRECSYECRSADE